MRQPLTTAAVIICVLTQAGFAAAAAPPTSDCVYSGGKRVRVERFLPTESGPRPAVLLLHGMDGMDEGGATYRSVAKRLAAKGYVVVLVHYFDRIGSKQGDRPALLKRFRTYLEDTAPLSGRWRDVEVAFTPWLEATEAALADVRSHPRVDPRRVALVGFSLGGYLASSAAARGGDARCVVVLFGGLPAPLAERAGKMPPALLIHGDADVVVPVREARGLRDLLKQKRRDCEFEVYKGVGHGFVRRDGKTDLWAAFRAERLAHSFLARNLRDDGARQLSRSR